ncbi:M24 family metallopeptidase [Vibrio lentus]|uniref:Peptidase M24 n=1 Tax=Vibrio lentus TaxID=136468 RepID=A0A2N7BSX6_9VIBR|nr:Xaa-Pro peptidase family protein [Vibrio lentus]PME47656.1 peptidase M24 [Vibrio lentus]PME62739.1 peptidase M24 [Vibrio lentus]PME78134.1 peptidase M24 [Vibrio lentus]PMI50134.1 peptidase M24 [Vibrio lentus]PMJ10693.1 peptidase M24 [Vibrio lentus]
MSILPLTPPQRGFESAELEQRTVELQQRLRAQNIDAAFFTTEPEFRYFSGFKSQFWESPTRPWFLVVPAVGKPIAVVPEIGVAGFDETWIEDVRSWPSPRPEDDGISLLASTLSEVSKGSRRIGSMIGPETHLRMPATNYALLQQKLSQHSVVDVSLMVRDLRSVKSQAEIDKVRFACQVTAAGFEYLRHHLAIGMTEREACKAMHLEMLRLGADACPYLISASGQGGYDNIIMGPTDRVLSEGDVLIIDTGANFDGYFSDFDRNYAFGHAQPDTIAAYDAVYQSTEAGLAIAEPGRTTGDVWQAMWSVLEKNGALGNDVGRMGHGLGMQLTEWPSHVPNGDVVLKPGMVLTLEPGMAFAKNRMMVHEENIVITESGCEMLHQRAWQSMPIITQ